MGAAALVATGLAPASAQTLSGAKRTQVIDLLTKGCLAEAGRDKQFASLDMRSFCRCSAIRVADRSTEADLDDMESARMGRIIDAANAACERLVPGAGR